MKRIRLQKWLLLVIIMSMMVTGAAAQSTAGPADTLLYLDFGASDGFIMVVNAAGSRIIDLHNQLYYNLVSLQWNTYYTVSAKLSPDGKWLAVGTGYTFEDRVVQDIRITNLEWEGCCHHVQLPPGTVAFDLAGFDESGTRLALSYVTENFEGGIMVVPFFSDESVAPGETIHLDMQEVAARLPELPQGMWAKMGDWKADGIRFHPNCYACEGISEGEYAIWNPDTGALTAHSGEFFSSFGARLEATGEMVVLANDPAYPASPQLGMLPPANVVRYSPDGDPHGPNSWVIYHNPDTLDLQQVDWVLDGQAVLVVPRDTYYWMLIHRDGTIQRIDYNPGNHFLLGTVEGWLAETGSEEGMSIFAHYDARGEGGRQEVAMFGPGMDIRMLYRLLGSSLHVPVQPFQPVIPPAATQCPGLLPARLMTGQAGQVTPGAPNRLRDNPSLTGSSMVGEIPGDGIFLVLQGPACDTEAGIVWWQVQYGELIGWTAEGQDGTYYLAPVE